MVRKRRQSPRASSNQWYTMDLHIHTPASNDYQQPGVTMLDILKEAERRKMDIIALTDHNTVTGYRRMLEEIEDLELLERLKRMTPEEAQRLAEYRSLLSKLLVLPGFEFTATLGFHILGIFAPDTPVRELEFLLRALRIPPDLLDAGATEVGATVDVLTAYRLINEAGGLVIAAHANSTHGVALQGLGFGGQTRIAYTQDPHLHALEVTDLDKRGPKTTARFFDGSKPDYPRAMRCIQGSDCHRLTRDPQNPRHLALGDRATEVLLREKSFAALREVFLLDDMALTRPYRPEAAHPFDHIQAAREQGPSIVQDFHEQYSKRGGYLDAIIHDVCAFANTNGGTLYIGLARDPRKAPQGLNAPTRVIQTLRDEIAAAITPELEVTLDVQETQGAKVVRLIVPRGPEPPYAVNENQIYIRSENETTLAVRDEIVELVKRGLEVAAPPVAEEPSAPAELASDTPPVSAAPEADTPAPAIEPPRTGVEIIEVSERGNTRYYTMHDLRNGSLVKNVTLRSARRLWRYAIQEMTENPVKPEQVRWLGEIGLWKRREYGDLVRYDLVQRTPQGLRVYYGVTEQGLHGPWMALISSAGESGTTSA